MSAHEMRGRLRRLMGERVDAIDAGLSGNRTYMRDLEHDLATAHEAYVGLVVTEIAALRGQLSGRQQG
jgi:hypothetical protein